MKNFIRSFITAILLISFSIQPALSYDLESSFRSLVSGTDAHVTGPSTFETQSRHVFAGGSLDIRIPHDKNIQLISLSPPKVSAGCGGISAYFGGFSFISGAEIKQFISQITQAAMGFVVQIAIHTLCPICDAVLQAMQKLAQMASKMSMDSCHTGEALAKELTKDVFTGGGTSTKYPYQTECGTLQADSNGNTDILDALGDVCKTAKDSIAKIKEFIGFGAGQNGTDDVDQSTMEEYAALLGNKTWTTLGAMGYEDLGSRTLLLNLIGTEIVDDSGNAQSISVPNNTSVLNPDGSWKTTDPNGSDKLLPQNFGASTVTVKQMEGGGLYYMPTLTNADAVQALMCGLNPKRNSYLGQREVAIVNPDGTAGKGFQFAYSNRVVQRYCDSWFKSLATKGKSRIIMDCSADPIYCKNMQYVDLASSQTMLSNAGEGFLLMVNDTLKQGAQAIASRKSIDEVPNLRHLIEVSPFPIYQILNLAVVYPAASEELLDAISLPLASLITVSELEHLTKGSITKYGPSSIPPEMVRSISNIIGDFNFEEMAKKEHLAASLTVQNLIQAQIKQVNSAMQAQIMSKGLSGNEAMADTMFSSVVRSERLNSNATPISPDKK